MRAWLLVGLLALPPLAFAPLALGHTADDIPCVDVWTDPLVVYVGWDYMDDPMCTYSSDCVRISADEPLDPYMNPTCMGPSETLRELICPDPCEL